LALVTAAQLRFTATTRSVRVNGVPAVFSRTSLRNRSVNDGKGPAVSLGVTVLHVALDPVGGAVVVVVEVELDAVEVGLVGVPLSHPIASTALAPSHPSTSRRFTFFDSCSIVLLSEYSTRKMLGICGNYDGWRSGACHTSAKYLG
jgi:hypothetical protein